MRLLLFLLLLLTLPAHAQSSQAVQVRNGYLTTTQFGQQVTHKPLPFFANPEQHAARWRGIDQYFAHRFGIVGVMNYAFWPKAIVLHSTESESEASVYNTFAQSGSAYLGGVWTTFAVDTDGTVVQYSPLDRLSKGQAGVNDLAVGIEIVGSASRYQGGTRVQEGSIARRYEAGNTAQMQGVQDLVATLLSLCDIPAARVYSHEEVARIGALSGQNPDFDWLKSQIQDAVYLGKKPLLNAQGQPLKTYGYLEPYGRSDPGADVMDWVRTALHRR